MNADTVSINISRETGLSRREFLNFAWLASLGFLCIEMAGVSYLFAMPRIKEGEFGGAFTVGNAAEIPPVDDPPRNYPMVKFWLSHHEKGLSALYKVCTHLGCIYNWQDQDNKFICPCHGSQFQRDGTYIQGPAPRSLDRFVIQLIDSQSGSVVAETDAEGNPLAVPPNFNGVVVVDTARRMMGPIHD